MGVLTDIGGAITVTNCTTQNSAAATITSSAINRFGLLSAVLAHSCGAASGTPDSFSVATKIQHATASGGSYSDLTGATATTLTADSTAATADINLMGANQYLKVVTIVAFVNGTSPKVPVNATLILGGSDHGPVA